MSVTNPLLRKIERRIVRVQTPSRPDLELHVRAITGAEFLSIGEKINDGTTSAGATGVQLEACVCDKDGTPLLAPGEGEQFLSSIGVADMRRLIDESDRLNKLTDQAVEEASKN